MVVAVVVVVVVGCVVVVVVVVGFVVSVVAVVLVVLVVVVAAVARWGCCFFACRALSCGILLLQRVLWVASGIFGWLWVLLGVACVVGSQRGW